MEQRIALCFSCACLFFRKFVHLNALCLPWSVLQRRQLLVAFVFTCSLTVSVSGSGIVEIKSYMFGADANLAKFGLFATKAIALCFSVAGFGIGTEGPLIHVSVCVALFLHALAIPEPKGTRSISHHAQSFVCAAAAASMGVSMGVPMGGVLFALEEISLHFERKTLWLSFICAVVSSLAMRVSLVG